MIRRVLLSTINYDHPQRGMIKAFSGIFPEVRDYDYLHFQRQGKSAKDVNEGLINVACEFHPDWIWLQLQDTNVLQPETLARIREHLPGCVVSHWMGDCRASVSSYAASICRVTHLSLLSNVGQLPLYEAAGAERAHYCQIGVDWEEDVLGLPDWIPRFRVPDVVFCGNYYGESFPGTLDRVEAIRVLKDKGIDVGIVGSGWPREFPVLGQCTVKQQHHVWKRAKVALSINNFNDIERYYSDRQLIAMASGTPVVCKYVPGLEWEFTDGIDCLWYRNSSELLAHVERLLGSEDERIRLGRQGRATICRQHTWWHRILNVLPIIEEIRDVLSNSAQSHAALLTR
jgi:hypothetical protein